MVAIDPYALGFPYDTMGERNYAIGQLQQYASQITFTFSPAPSLPAGFPTTFTLGDVVGGNPNPRAGGSAYNGYYDFDIYGLPSLAAADAATSQPVAVTVTFPTSLPINCGGPLGDAIPLPLGTS